MKKFALFMCFAFLFANASFTQNGGIFQRGAEEKTNSTKGTPFLPPHGEEGDQNATPIGNGVLFLTALGAAYAIRKKHKN